MSRLKIPILALEPSLWGTLPNELLHIVFACLPVAKIGQLRVLSKEWKRNVDCKNSEFNHIFDATAHLNAFVVLPWRYFSWVGNIYDVQADKWHFYKTDAILEKVETWDGADRGLVCCVTKRKWCDNNSRNFIVINPLTKQKKQFPPLLYMGIKKSNTLVTEVKMVKLTKDKKTKEYKVFVVGFIANGGSGFFAQIYDSQIKKWTVVEAIQGHIIGWDYSYVDNNLGTRRMLCMYNCADGTLQHFNETDIAYRLNVGQGCCVLLEDHLFVLHKEASPSPANLLEDDKSMLPKYCISEFHLLEKTTAWVKLGVCRCGPFKCFHKSRHGIINLRLWGCNGFLLVHDDGYEHSWLYNFQLVSGAPFQPLEGLYFSE